MRTTAIRVVLAGYYPPPLGGESVHVWDLAARLRARGSLDRVVNLRRGAMPSPEYVLGAGPVRLRASLARLLSCDTVLHLHTNGHNWKSWLLIGTAAAALRRRATPAVLTLHSGLSPAFLARMGRPGRRFCRAALAPFTRTIAVNEDIRTALVRLGIQDERLSVHPAFLGLPPDWRNTGVLPGLDGFRPLISVVAGVGPEYGLPLMLTALKELTATLPGLGCAVLGVDDAGEAGERVRQLALTQRVRLLGPQPRARCLSVIERSDLFVRPSLADGDAVSVREALALGVPVVASATAFRPSGVTLFRPGDCGDLTAKILQTLEVGRKLPHLVEPPKDVFEELMGVYEMASGARR